jgi:hypothetical protein
MIMRPSSTTSTASRYPRWLRFSWSKLSLAVAALGALAALLLSQTPAKAQFFELFSGNHQTDILKRGVTERIVYDFPETGLKVTMPRFLSKPRKFKTAGGDVLVMLRTPEDTCGLYQLSETIAPYDAGPPPHFHYDTSEWFLPTEESRFRIYGTQKAKPLTPGQLPGVTVPAPAMGSIVIEKGGLAYSPKGTVHFWHNESSNRDDIRGFYNIWTPANGVNNWFAGESSVNGSTAPLAEVPGPQATLLQTALWGVPHDPTGRFVGRSDYRNLRGPVASDGNHLAELQELFDRGEACYPRS